MRKFEDIDLHDSIILELRAKNGSIVLKIQDWQEKTITLHFVDVLGYVSCGVEGEDVQGGISTPQDDFLVKLRQLQGIEIETYKCYTFHSSWDSNVFLKIVAQNCLVE